MIDIEELRNEGWWADDGRTGCFVVPFEDVQDYIIKLKLQFEERLANAVNEAYDEGYNGGLLNGVCGG